MEVFKIYIWKITNAQF